MYQTVVTKRCLSQPSQSVGLRSVIAVEEVS